ncbi:MAG: hypothetical protein WAM44_07540, partial [Chthoniobacterales bacterium]
KSASGSRKIRYHIISDCTLQDIVVLGSPETMFWRIMFWVAVAEVALCVLPIEVTGVTAMVRFLFFGG